MTAPLILQFTLNTVGLQSLTPRRVKVLTTATYAQLTAAGFLNSMNPEGLSGLLKSDVLDITYNYTTPSAASSFAQFTPSFSGSTITLVETTISTSQVGGQTVSASTSSATPGTVRSLTAKMTGTATTMTSGNLVGGRGELDVVGASGGFLYGQQGKVIVTGSLSGSSWTAGVFGQVDISAATINAGQIATLWGDYGSTSHTLTDKTGMYGIAMTNTTAAVLAAQIYLYGGATDLMLLSTNVGGVGATYVATPTGATASGDLRTLKINIDGATYYILAAAVYSS